MARNVFSKIQKKFESSGNKARTNGSKEWFIKNLKNLGNISRASLLSDESLVKRNKPLIGRMFMYFYDPKGKDTLPYYDRFPLIIMVGPAPGGFYGLNLHYLPLRLRAIFFDELLEHTNNDKFDSSTRIKLTYELLRAASKMRAFKPCYKRYLYKHIVSKTVEVPPSEWETALFLPSDDFVKVDKRKAWRNSKKFALQ